MTALRLTPLALVASLLAAHSTQAALIDDFNTPGLGDYTLYKVLDQGATSNVSFSDPAGTLEVSSAGADGAEQVLFLRGDVSLAQGEELRVDGPATISGANDFGLAVGQTPVGLAGAGDNRSLADFMFISYRSSTQLNSRGFNGNSEVGQVQAFGVNATRLFIARTLTDDIELGYYDGSVRNVLRTDTPATTDIFSNVGFYGDLRGDGNSGSALDNLTVGAPIPEPTSLALVAFGTIGIVTRRNRRC